QAHLPDVAGARAVRHGSLRLKMVPAAVVLQTCLREARLRCEDVGPGVRAFRESARFRRPKTPKVQANNDRRRNECVRNQARSSCDEPVPRVSARLRAHETNQNLPEHLAEPSECGRQARPGNGSAVFSWFPSHTNSLRIGTNLSFTCSVRSRLRVPISKKPHDL